MYDFLKWFSLIAIPAISALLVTIGDIWDYDTIVKIGATVSAVGVALGSALGFSSNKYYKENSDGVQSTD